MHEVRTTCPYCGVGCGLIASVDDGGVSLRGDPNHPANFGRLCSKGLALGETLGLEGRLLHPEIGGRRVEWAHALDQVAAGFRDTIERYGPDSVALYLSGQLLTEDYYVANKLMKGFVGSANVDTNSRLCMSSAVAGHQRAFGSDTVPGCYEDLERAKLVVLVGSNTAWCHPVLFQRIARARRDNDEMRVVVIDPRRTDTGDLADLHLPLAPGSDGVLFNGLLVHLADAGETDARFIAEHTAGFSAALAAARESAPDAETVAARCGLDRAAVERFFRLFARTERVVTAFSQGINQSSSGTDKVNAIINCHLATGRIGRPGAGPLSLTGQPNAMGGREVGGLANQLAAHMRVEDPAARDRVRRFWNAPTMIGQPGLKAVDLFRAVEAGEIRALWVMGTNPAVSLPEADRMRAALARCDLLVVSDCVRHTDTTAQADVLLPSLAWGEKSGTVTNSERRISRQRPFLPPPGDARADWWQLAAVAQRLGFGAAFDYGSPFEIFSEHARLSAFENGGSRDFDLSAWADLDAAWYQDLDPLQWPVTAAAPQGTERLFGDGNFFTADRRARFVPVTPRAPVRQASEQYPYVLNTGRLRDQWHTMTRTGASPRLSTHQSEPAVALHPEDAARLGLVAGALAVVRSGEGSAIVRVQLDPGMRAGSAFVPIHWSGPFASEARIGALIAAETDPISGQPELKHGSVGIEPFACAWHAVLMSRRELSVGGVDYWAKSRGAGLWRFALAGRSSPESWPEFARALLCAPQQEVGWAEYADEAAGSYRAARFVDGRVESFLAVAPVAGLAGAGWIESLFGDERLTGEQRSALLSGRPPAGGDCGRIVCACKGVGEAQLSKAIQSHAADSVEALGNLLGAGTGCGSCIPELRRMIAQR